MAFSAFNRSWCWWLLVVCVTSGVCYVWSTTGDLSAMHTSGGTAPLDGSAGTTAVGRLPPRAAGQPASAVQLTAAGALATAGTSVAGSFAAAARDARALLKLLRDYGSDSECAVDARGPNVGFEAEECGAAEPAEHWSDATRTICDGSRDIRLVFSRDMDGSSGPYYFASPFGYVFSVVDGRCRYYASTSYMQGTFTGRLTHDEAVSLAKQLQYGRSDTWTGRHNANCATLGGTMLATPSGAVWCNCDCATAPDHVSAAMSSLGNLTERWVKRGKPLDQGVSALAYVAGDVRNRRIETWPLTRDIKSIPKLLSTGETRMETGAAFEAGAEAKSLRSLRQRVFMPTMGFDVVRVRDTDGTAYSLYIRDDMPSDVTARVNAFLATRR